MEKSLISKQHNEVLYFILYAAYNLWFQNFNLIHRQLRNAQKIFLCPRVKVFKHPPLN